MTARRSQAFVTLTRVEVNEEADFCATTPRPCSRHFDVFTRRKKRETGRGEEERGGDAKKSGGGEEEGGDRPSFTQGSEAISMNKSTCNFQNLALPSALVRPHIGGCKIQRVRGSDQPCPTRLLLLRLPAGTEGSQELSTSRVQKSPVSRGGLPVRESAESHGLQRM